MENPIQCIPVSIFESFDAADLDILRTQIEDNIEAAAENDQEMKSLFSFAKASKNVKGIPYDISGDMLDNMSATLYDFRIDSKGPDDKIYLNNTSIREKITRGLSFLEVTQNKKVVSLDLIVYANRKFSGNAGDDDDFISEEDDSWRKYCLQSSESAEKIVCTSKLNGEAGHLSGRFLGNTFYYCIGSKNVHMLLRSDEDINRYTDSRYRVATVAAKAIMRTISTLPEDSISFLQNLLHFTKITMVFEILQPDYQHIIDISTYSEVTPFVLMCCPTAGSVYERSLTAFSPDITLKMAKAIGFLTTEYDVLNFDQLQNRISQVRSERETEGAVLYYLNESRHTIGLIKLKSYWYVLLRALREKADYHFGRGNKKGFDIKVAVSSTKKRFHQIQSWLKFSDHYLREWQALGESFLNWLHNEIKERRLNHQQIRPEYPQIWKNFLMHTSKTDDIENPSNSPT